MNEFSYESQDRVGAKDSLRKYTLWAILIGGFAVLCICLPCAALMD
jgi:hypothetical protein